MNNTIMKNITTATAATSNGQPAPAGLSTSLNSALLQASLPVGSPLFSNPLLFNNIFWDNRAGAWTGNGVAGIGLDGDPFPINNWDVGMQGLTFLLEPTNSILQTPTGTVADASNLINQDPLVIQSYDTSVQVLPWRTNPHFVGVDIVAVDLPPTLMGDYHLQAGSPAIDAGVASKSGQAAPTRDIDNDPRPSGAGYEIGADETGAFGLFLTVIPGAYEEFVRAPYLVYIPLISK
jgi:hypothetical protein